MSKKKKKSGKGKYYESIYSKRKKKDNKKKKSSYYGKPAFKTVKPSLSKKEAKESKKILLAPVDIPKDFMKNRAKCNHAGDLISVAEFKAMTPNYGAFTPMLDQMIKTYGEDNLAICKGCYDVVVKASLMSTEKMEDAIATLYAAANTILSRKRMKNTKNIEKISKIKNDLADWNDLVDRMGKLEDDNRLEDATDVSADTISPEELGKLSRSDTAFTC